MKQGFPWRQAAHQNLHDLPHHHMLWSMLLSAVKRDAIGGHQHSIQVRFTVSSLVGSGTTCLDTSWRPTALQLMP